MIKCIIDCRLDKRLENEFLTLNVWGSPVFSYVTKECLSVHCFDSVYLLTDSEYVAESAKELFGRKVVIVDQIPREDAVFFMVSGRAVMLTKETIADAIAKYKGGGYLHSAKMQAECFMNTPFCEGSAVPVSFLKGEHTIDINAFFIGNFTKDFFEEKYLLNEKESLVINTGNDFELALILKKKERNVKLLRNSIEERIREKREILEADLPKSVCLAGHSQLDNWEVEELCGMPVRNCGIRGISSFEYEELILNRRLLNVSSKVFVVMHGTNDIVYPYKVSEIVSGIMRTPDYIRRYQPEAKICFVSCLHVNGRADRSNRKIDELNFELKKRMEKSNIFWIDTGSMDDRFGCLRQEYTEDGLHLSGKGYSVLKRLIEERIERLLQ